MIGTKKTIDTKAASPMLQSRLASGGDGVREGERGGVDVCDAATRTDATRRRLVEGSLAH